MSEEVTANSRGPFQETTQSSGRNTEEYNRVKTELTTITNALSSIPDASMSLKQKFVEKGWLRCVGKQTEEELVTLTLGRIELDVNQYEEFLRMLGSIEGMDLIVKRLSVANFIHTSNSQVHNLPARTEELCTSIIGKGSQIAAKSNHHARCNAIRKLFPHICDYIKEKIDKVAVEAYSLGLINLEEMEKCTISKRPKAKKSHIFLCTVNKHINDDRPDAYEHFLEVLHSQGGKPEKMARLIMQKEQEEAKKQSKPETNVTEEPSSSHPEPYSVPVGSDFQSLSRAFTSRLGPLSGSGNTNPGKSSVNSSGSMHVREAHESTDWSITPQTATVEQDTTTKEDEGEGHPQSGLSHMSTPVPETGNSPQIGKDFEMADKGAVLPVRDDLTKENYRLLEENKELKQKLDHMSKRCMELQEEVISLQKEKIKMLSEGSI